MPTDLPARRGRLLPLALSLLLAPAVAGASHVQSQPTAPFSFGGAGIDPAAFRVTVFADGLNFPYGMALLPDGAMVVGTSNPVGGSYFGSTGELLRLADTDGDGRADETTVLAGALPGTITAVVRAGRLLFVTSAQGGQERISVLRRGRSWTDPLTLAGSINFHFSGFEHQSYSLVVRRSPGAAGAYDLFFNVGAYANDDAGGTVDVSGLVTATLVDAAIYMVTVEDTGETPTVSDPVLIATGLRNAVGMAFEPGSGDLLLADNGIDAPWDRLEPLSADELNRIPAAEIGGEPEDFGFPGTYVEYRTGVPTGEGGIAPDIAFQPIAGAESEGPAGLAVAPPGFPEGLNDGVFIGFHGQFDLTSQENEENAVVYADPTTGDYHHVIAPGLAGVGHLDSLLSTRHALYLADLCANGSLGGADPCGGIYLVRVMGDR